MIALKKKKKSVLLLTLKKSEVNTLLTLPPKMGPGSVFGRKEAKMSAVNHQLSCPVFLLSTSIPWILITLTLTFVFLEELWSSLDEIFIGPIVTLHLSQPTFLADASQVTHWFTRQPCITQSRRIKADHWHMLLA